MPLPTICRVMTFAAAVVAWPAVVGATGPAAESGLVRDPSWSIPSVEVIRTKAEHWPAGTASAPLEPAAAAAVRREWDDVIAGRRDRLDAVVRTIACRDPRVSAAADDVARGTSPDLGWLADPATDPFVRDAVTLWWGRELVRRDRFDEALPLLVGLDLGDSVDPATILFHRAACEHWLVEVDAAIESLDRLLEREHEIPVRYARVASLLRADLARFETGSLDHVARRMRDATRRLDLGRAGPATVEVQQGVIGGLDKLIERLEQHERQDEQQGGGAAGGGSESGQGGAGSPMDDSRIARGRGPGDVRAKDLAPGDSWGDLPPHDRDRALQQIGREFPPHYREAIEQYFKRLATGREDR